MCDFDCLTTQQILEALTEEISSRQGKVTDTVHLPGQLFVRSVLPEMQEIRARDHVQAGVALHATETAVWVYPYVFRLVCRNGAIMAHAAEGKEISDFENLPAFEVGRRLREAVEACCDRDAFGTAARQMRAATRQPMDAILDLMPFLSRVSTLSPDLVRQVLQQFLREEDRTRYGLMNAITATARDNPEPLTRWRLEELGGQMALLVLPGLVRDDGAEEAIPKPAQTLVGAT